LPNACSECRQRRHLPSIVQLCEVTGWTSTIRFFTKSLLDIGWFMVRISSEANRKRTIGCTSYVDRFRTWAINRGFLCGLSSVVNHPFRLIVIVIPIDDVDSSTRLNECRRCLLINERNLSSSGRFLAATRCLSNLLLPPSQYRYRYMRIEVFGNVRIVISCVGSWVQLFITFGGRSAHLAYHVHESGRKTSIIIIIIIIVVITYCVRTESRTVAVPSSLPWPGRNSPAIVRNGQRAWIVVN